MGWDGLFFAVDVGGEKHFGNFVAYNTQRLAVTWHNLTVPKEVQLKMLSYKSSFTKNIWSSIRVKGFKPWPRALVVKWC